MIGKASLLLKKTPSSWCLTVLSLVVFRDQTAKTMQTVDPVHFLSFRPPNLITDVHSCVSFCSLAKAHACFCDAKRASMYTASPYSVTCHWEKLCVVLRCTTLVTFWEQKSVCEYLLPDSAEILLAEVRAAFPRRRGSARLWRYGRCWAGRIIPHHCVCGGKNDNPVVSSESVQDLGALPHVGFLSSQAVAAVRAVYPIEGRDAVYDEQAEGGPTAQNSLQIV